tara:strand:- start:1187 stop:1540 length:354 start_codon:yes stop_codon:yes gene_type:complete
MSFYSDMAAEASTLLVEFGESVTLKYTTGGTVDPVAGTVTGAAQSIVANGYPGEFNKNEVDQTNILSTDVRLILEKTAVIPAPNHLIELGGKDYRVINNRQIGLTSDNVINIVQLRL